MFICIIPQIVVIQLYVNAFCLFAVLLVKDFRQLFKHLDFLEVQFKVQSKIP